MKNMLQVTESSGYIINLKKTNYTSGLDFMNFVCNQSNLKMENNLHIFNKAKHFDFTPQPVYNSQ